MAHHSRLIQWAYTWFRTRLAWGYTWIGAIDHWGQQLLDQAMTLHGWRKVTRLRRVKGRWTLR